MGQAAREGEIGPPSGYLAGLFLFLAIGSLASPTFAQDCLHFEAKRQPFFGDVHVHSDRSFDSYLFGSRNGPRDAYRFARGEVVGLAPFDELGNPGRTYQLRAPLDFAAVTDHAEMLGETRLCTVNGLGFPACDAITEGSLGSAFAFFGSQFGGVPPERRALCGENDLLCLAAASVAWGDIVLAAEEFNDTSPECTFSSFVGYEWTASPAGDNLHRNVLFRGSDVPDLPLSYVEVQTPEALWTGLRSQCEGVGGDCEALTIPHNSNMSGGETFRTTLPDGSPLGFDDALLRREMEPLVELTQHKGDSECRIGVGTSDELCTFEKIATLPPEEDEPLNYVRNVLAAGLDLDANLGINPFTLGLIGSTDTHNGTPGAAQEDDFPGHLGELDGTPAALLTPGRLLDNPGGLMVLWAEENTRDSLFAAMQRRESYATSGTRPTVRFFGGFDMPTDICGLPDPVQAGYDNGVAMGGELAANLSSPAPRFVLQADQDPGAGGVAGTALAELQIIKGWRDDLGNPHERVVSVAGGAPPPGAVDLLTCEPDGSGFSSQCAVWEDDDFDPEEHAFYYARVVESPTCRWSTQICRAQGVDCTSPAPAGFEACCDGSFEETIQERATTSPIWMRPVPEPNLVSAVALGGLALAGLFRKRSADRCRS